MERTANITRTILAAVTALFALLLTTTVTAQQFRLTLDHDVYDYWRNLQRPAITNDGRWVSWEVNPQDGDGWLYLLELRTGIIDSVSRGHNAVFSPNSNYMAFYVSPPKETLRRAKAEGLSGDRLPQDSVGIYLFDRSSNRRPGEAGSFMVPQEESDWMAYLLRQRPTGTNLIVFNPVTGEEYEFAGVTKFSISRNGRIIGVITERELPGSGETETGNNSSGNNNPVDNNPGHNAGDSPTGRSPGQTGDNDLARNTTESKPDGGNGDRGNSTESKPDGGNGDRGNSTGDLKQVTVMIFNTETRTVNQVLDAPGSAKSIRTSPCGTRAAFLFAPAGDTMLQAWETAQQRERVAVSGGHARLSVTGPNTGNGNSSDDPPVWDLWHWTDGDFSAVPAVTRQTPGMPGGWSVSEHGNMRFSDKGGRIIFGTAPVPTPEPKDTLLDEEKARVDIWHYRDPLIQPQQLVQAQRERERTFTAVYRPGDGHMTQLATPLMPHAEIAAKEEGDIALGVSTIPYQIQNSFESGDYADIYLVDVSTGESTLVLEKHRGSTHRSALGDARLSPEGKYLVWYSQFDSNWHAMPVTAGGMPGDPHRGSNQDNHTSGSSPPNHTSGSSPPNHTSGGTAVNLTAMIPVPLHDELHDQPSLPGSYGIAAFTRDDTHVLIYDRYDIWMAALDGNEPPVNLTGGYGRSNNIRLRYTNPCPRNESPSLRDEIMLSALNHGNKQSGFYSIRPDRPGQPSLITMEDARYFTPQKARDANVLIWRRSTFTEFPDLWHSNMNFRRAGKISNANPQQRLYRWGDARLVEWVSFSNDTLQGILYTPENMDEGGQYPMIVYFYERMSDNLHAHYVPAPSRSTVNISYAVSNGYVVFVPDIPYIVGYPGQSAYNAVVSGTMAMMERYDFIDRANTGVQGQSWAGYQIAWLITRTDLYRAAMAGAPVSNMVSAYGGIRWATGLSRIYQYEETQSRIGGTLWEMPLRYIENSPLFFADKVNTPLLMMHNDSDGAVPWYQGIEYYMALRRLGKPVWMLNYNNEAHNLTRRPNMKDLSVRMFQFFDHYLKGEPAPAWMTEGIPATEKGRRNGLEMSE